MKTSLRTILAICCLLSFTACSAQQVKTDGRSWINFKGKGGPGIGKHIVLISGDEEYRSEEAMPALASMLSKEHGFDCTVLFAIDSANGMINPSITDNIPGLHLLQDADMIIIFTRFRNLPATQMSFVEAYLAAGKPIIAMRTSTHAFNYPADSPFFKYSYNSTVQDWEGGFGKRILGETWVGHHGDHGSEGTRTAPVLADHPILTGVGSIWVPTDVYTVDLSDEVEVLLEGRPTLGMDETSPLNKDKIAMPVAWVKPYQVPGGKAGMIFTTTMGSSVDLLDQHFRRLLVNASFWATGLESLIHKRLSVELSENYKPTMFGFDTYIRNTYPINKKY